MLFFSILFFIILCCKNTNAEEVGLKVENYIKNLNFFSSKFIQSNGSSLEEGYIYIKDTKIRLDYFYPDRTLIISKKKGVYINHELKEESFFSTKKNIVKIFYDIFLDHNFFASEIFVENNGEIFFEKKITIDSTKTSLKIFFENNPLLLRKIIAENANEVISISFNEHNYNSVFDEKLFSFVPIYSN
ncbi:outer-membrane lipoprotein carrier protein LolA [Pelagibacteraceae bacterium]|nr:outer-membrane lipoprotein carrier protein LolA [Pelagibacteraceae bacterium]